MIVSFGHPGDRRHDAINVMAATAAKTEYSGDDRKLIHKYQ